MRCLFLLFAIVFTALPPQPVQARMETIAAIVNEDAISISDVDDRVRLIIISSGLQDSKEIRSKILPQVIDSLIDEQIKLQEGERLGIEVTPEEVQEGFSTIARQNNLQAEQFMNALRKSGINPGTMERQIRAEITWGKIVKEQLRPQIIVSDADIEGYLQRLRGNKGKMQYLVAEIFLPVEEPQQESNIRQLADRLVNEMRAGKAPFSKVAQQFSKAAGAVRGGDIGWVQQGQLPEELDSALMNMQENSISNPIRSLGGYHILLLRNMRQISEDNMPGSEEVMTIIGLERLDRLQRRYLLDLKSAAFVENRVGF